MLAGQLPLQTVKSKLHYIAEYKVSTDTAWQDSGSNNITSTNVAISNRNGSLSYDVRVKAVNSAGAESPYVTLSNITYTATTTTQAPAQCLGSTIAVTDAGTSPNYYVFDGDSSETK